MKATPASIPDLLVIEPQVFGDSRGFFMESFNQKMFNQVTRLDVTFVQDNQSRSMKGVLRGLHYQIQQPQGKLVRAVRGSIFDVAVDIRKSSPYFGQWFGITLSEENYLQLWVPAGFAHGFCVLSDTADVLYKTTDYYAPQFERCLRWNDPSVGIEWPCSGDPQLSDKDKAGATLREADVFP
jgi:dTDP-4-dehydrorhamnose 3,5-epimerase